MGLSLSGPPMALLMSTSQLGLFIGMGLSTPSAHFLVSQSISLAALRIVHSFTAPPPSPVLNTFDECEAAGGQIYNADCFIERFCRAFYCLKSDVSEKRRLRWPASHGRAGRKGACGSQGFPANLWWIGAANDLGYTAGSGVSTAVYILALFNPTKPISDLESCIPRLSSAAGDGDG